MGTRVGWVAASVAAALGSAISFDAAAATLYLTDTVTYNGSANVLTGASNPANNIDPTSSWNYGNTPLHDQLFPSGTVDFYDDYVFTTRGAVGNSITTKISLGDLNDPNLAINNLQVRLYRIDASNPAGTTGSVSTNIVDSWSTSVNLAPGVTSTLAITLPAAFGAGTYDLQIRGDVAGGAGGSYSGVLNLVPVPLPAALPLLLSGLGLFGGLVGRSKRVA